jgi:uncharacterized membrane protein (UPF0127 family)
MAGQAVVQIRDKSWNVAVAATYSELVTGLGGISSLPAGYGMLFDLGGDQYVSVTTEPMLFSLDIAFISSALGVVGLAEDVPPGQQLTCDQPARFFLEVNAGEMAELAVEDPVSIAVTQPAAGQTAFSVAQLQAILESALPIIGAIFGIPAVVKALKEPEKKG